MAVSTVYIVDANGARYGVELTGLPDGNNAFSSIITDLNGVKPLAAPGGFALQVSADGAKPAYHVGAAGLTCYSGAQAVLLEIQGSATKTVRVKHIELWIQAGTKFFTELELLRANGLSGSGTPTAATRVRHDTNDPGATAVINYYTAAATNGSGAAILGAKVIGIAAPTASLGIVPAIWDFSRNQDKALVLRGTSDVFQVYNTITGLGTATFGFDVEWEEDSS